MTWGTTNSLAAYFTQEGPKIIPNRLGHHLTPSVVSMDEENQIYVGKTARERMALYPGTAAEVFQAQHGNRQKIPVREKGIFGRGAFSFVLRSLKEDAESFLGEEVTEAVISVPAYFNDSEEKSDQARGRAGRAEGGADYQRTHRRSDRLWAV